MSGLPYPVTNPGLPYPEQDMAGGHGQTVHGVLPYPISATSESFPCPPMHHPSEKTYQAEPSVPCIMFPYPSVPSHMMPQTGLGALPYPIDGHIEPFPKDPSPTMQASSTPFVQPYPTGEYEGPDSIETVEYNDGLRKDIFSRSGILGRAINKGKIHYE